MFIDEGNYAYLALLVFAVSVMSGGCGGGGDSLPSSQSVNDMMNGAWTYDSGTVTANVGGTRQEVRVMNFSVLFENCDIEEATGSASFTALAPLQGENFILPLLFDRTTLATARTDLDTWAADTEHGRFTITLLSDDKARLSGSVKWFDSISTDIDVVISKLPSTAPTVDINSALNGEWQTQVTVSEDGETINFIDGGGYRFHDGNIVPVAATFMNMTFSDTDIQAGTTKLTGIAVEEVVDVSGETPEYNTVYSVLNGRTAKISHLFRDVYLISGVSPYPVMDISFIAAFTGGRLSIISEGYTTYNGVVEENRGLFTLSRTTESNIAGIDEFIGSSWKSSMTVLDVYKDDENAALLDVELMSFDVSFPSADIENMKLAITTNAVVKAQDQTAYEDISAALNVNSAVLNVKNAGYNILLGESDAGNMFTITLITDKLAIVTGDIGYMRDDWYDVDFLAVVHKIDGD